MQRERSKTLRGVRMRHYSTKVAVIGASLGGVMAAWQLCRAGVDTLLTSAFPWIGGQLTSQAVPPDEHRFIESFGASCSYRDFRTAMREHYLQQAEFVDNSRMTAGCNPGDGWVSRLCVEPVVAERYLRRLLQPYIDSGRLQLLENSRPVGVEREGRNICSVTVSAATGESEWLAEITADYFLDATDTGELLVLADIPYRLGKESHKEFSEPQAPLEAERADQQPVTFVCALRRLPAPQAPVPRPTCYEFWRAHVLPHYDYPLFSDHLPGHEGFGCIRLPFFARAAITGDAGDPTLDLWRYRRVVAAHNWRDGRDDVSLINWAQNDYALHPLLDGTAMSEGEVIAAARQLTLCFVHWLQTEAPRECLGEPGVGFPELVLATDVLGTDDGFAQQVYVRESRRLVALETLTQCDIILCAAEETSEQRWQPARCTNSVGIGLYNMDIHPTCVSGMGTNASVRPFELPLGIFIAADVDNLLPACKNIGVTHLVNAATRVHPIEWLVGEVAGLLAAHCVQSDTAPAGIYESDAHVAEFQQRLQDCGIPLHWPEHTDDATSMR